MSSLEKVANLLPRLKAYLPPDLYGELCAAVFIDEDQKVTADDIRLGQDVAARLGLAEALKARGKR
jgi:hypothetical protein